MESFAWLTSVILLMTTLGPADLKQFQCFEGGIIRGPRLQKDIALLFTGHEYAEGGEIILDELWKYRAKASFFLTGDFLRHSEFKGLIQRIAKEGHYLGPHSDKHRLYCSWEPPKKTLLSREGFELDLENNLKELERFGVNRISVRYWVPAYEWYNGEIVKWSRKLGLHLINFTPGTGSAADYTESGSRDYVPSKVIFESILKKESQDPNGLNGFLLLMHIGAGPGRSDKMHDHLGDLLEALTARGYRFLRVDDLLR